MRGALALLLVAIAPFAPATTQDDVVRFGLVVAFAWIPLAGAVSHLASSRRRFATDLAALATDLGLVVLVEACLDLDPLGLLAILVVPVAAATYLGGRVLGSIGAAGAFVVVAASGDAGAFVLAEGAALLVVVAWLVDVVATDRWEASTGMLLLDERSDAILTGVGEAVVVTDRRGRIDQWNRAASATFDCPADAARGRRCHEVLGLHHDMRELDCSNGCPLLDAREVEVWRRSPTGARQPLLASVSPVLDEDGEVVEVVHSYRDITRLKQADEAKTLFLATASHELKTPLTVIRGFSQMLLLPEVVLNEDERQAALRAIDARAGQLTAIVDRLLMSSRIDAGRIDLEPSAADLAPVLRERADTLERATGREVELDLEDGLPEAWCDPDACTTVVDHLLDNAVKYSPAGDPITLSATSTADEVIVVVADRGIGMTPEQAEHCFDRFWQAEATDVRRFGGTGIGLYIVRSLVEGMGARISVTTAPGAGSAFHIAFARADRVGVSDEGRGEQSMIREYMRQLGLVGREAPS